MIASKTISVTSLSWVNKTKRSAENIPRRVFLSVNTSSCFPFAVGSFPMHDLMEWSVISPPQKPKWKILAVYAVLKGKRNVFANEIVYRSSLANMWVSGDPGAARVTNNTKAFQFQVTSLPGQGPDFRYYFRNIHKYSLSLAATEICRWWLTVESELGKTPEAKVLSPGFLCDLERNIYWEKFLLECFCQRWECENIKMLLYR